MKVNNTSNQLNDEFAEIKKSLTIAKSKEGQSLVLYQDYDLLLTDLIERLSERRELINLKNKVKAFRDALNLERNKYYGNGGGIKNKRRKRRSTKKKL